MIKNLRPRQAADALGFGLTKFWDLAKTDPDFPTLVKLGPRTTVVDEHDLQVYMQKRRDRQIAANRAAADAKREAVAA